MRTVVCPTDFSDNAFNALDFSAQLCKELNAKLLLVHVLHVPAVDVYSPANILTEMMDTQRKVSDSKLETLAETLVEKYDVPTAVRSEFGFAAELIVNVAEGVDASLICLGTRGTHSSIERFLGSVSYDVAKTSNRPVMVIPEEAEFSGMKKWVVANDKTEPIDHELEDIQTLFEAYDPQMDIITVHTEGKDEFKVEVEQDNGSLRIVNIYAGNVSEGICRYVDESAANCLGLKRHQRNFIHNLLHRSTIKDVLGKSHIPVLVSN